MYLGTREERNSYTKILNGKSVQYTLPRMMLRYKCDDCGNDYEKQRNGKDLREDRLHFCRDCYTPSRVGIVVNQKKQSIRKAGSIGECRTTGKTKYVEVWVGYDSWHYKPETKRRNGWIREHIFVMQEKLGTTIPPGYVVHHIDGDKRNNIDSNLILLTIAEHNNAHAKSESIIFDMVRSGLVIFNRDTKMYEVKK